MLMSHASLGWDDRLSKTCCLGMTSLFVKIGLCWR